MPDAATMTTPLRAEGEEMYQRAKTHSAWLMAQDTRPLSQWTEILDDNDDSEDDDNSEFEEYSHKNSFESYDSRRRSQTTLSSFDETPTPCSEWAHRPFALRLKPVEGPRGPHLFRSSQSSVDYTLQLSPLLPKQAPLQDIETISPRETAGQFSQAQPDHSIETALDETDIESNPREIIRRWSPKDVIEWMVSWEIDPSVVQCFERHDINGDLLLNLEFDDLRDLDIESFGKRHHLWNAICILRGDDEPSLELPAQPETARPSTTDTVTISPSKRPDQSGSRDGGDVMVPTTPSAGKKRRGRKASDNFDVITPAESVSIVAIEQLLPKPHRCSKGERCSKWRKQQRQIEQLHEEHGIGQFPISPASGGRIFVAGDPGNAATAENLVPNVFKQTHFLQPQPPTPADQDTFRPTSEVVPSVVASSDLLGPGQVPQFALQADRLERVEMRDPQDNVRQFLSFQHVHSPTNIPLTPLGNIVEPGSIPRAHSVPAVPPMFPTQHYQAYPSLYPPRSNTVAPQERFRALPKLEIPRSSSAGPSSNPSCPDTVVSPQTGLQFCRSSTASPTQVYRLGTPASEMDVPVTAVPADVIARDTSQSVPPNMVYRQPLTRSGSHRNAPDWRRPSMTLPAVKEGEVFSPAKQIVPDAGRPSISSQNSQDSTSTASSVGKKSVAKDPAHESPLTQRFGYGSDCSHAGWMKKRRTKMLRHEWQAAHFRLMGTQLNMHDSARLNASLMNSINTDDYAVACSSVASNSKLAAAMRAFHIRNQDSSKNGAADGPDAAAFAFQLVPHRDAESGKKHYVTPGSNKTHHFAVTTKDERIDWMRELMLAKALQQKGKGYDVEVNGMQA